ncbi:MULTISPECIES: hypothetical protein [Arenibacter]|uniref:hypothetical protein n=1 Tax=Arenibacter TaxID=178469 RepID=UPI000A369511|nr:MULTISPECIES: hypothetical protein [Arenibacter]
MNLILATISFLILLSFPSKEEARGVCLNKDAFRLGGLHEGNRQDTLLNSNNYLVLGNKQATVKVIHENKLDSFPAYEVLGTYQSDIIIGKGMDKGSWKIFRKYQPQTNFKDFPAGIYQGKLAAPNFSSYPESESFKSRIQEACKKGINFAGHYTLVVWGCGATCQRAVVVDRKTGEIFEGFHAALGAEYKNDSKMIIKNVGAIDSDSSLIELCAFCVVHHEVWTGTEFKKVD